MEFRKWLTNVQIRSELLCQSGVDKEANLHKGFVAFKMVKTVRLKQSTPFVVQAIPQSSQANPEVAFNGQWLAEKISDNIYNLTEIGLSA